MAREISTRPTLRLTLECDNACIFCCQDGLTSDDTRSLDARIDALAEAGETAVTLVGGEPLLVDDVVSIVDRLRTRGFTQIGVQTNGALLGDDPDAASRLTAAGLTDVHLSIHGARAEVHDYHTGREGSFDRVVRALEAARKARLDIVVSTVLTRSNQAVLSELPSMLSSASVKAWSVVVPVAAGRAEDRAPSVLPRLSVALPYALHALDRARRASLSAFIAGAPLCLVGPFAERSLPAAPRAYADACEGCASKGRCPGIDPLYLELLGAAELRPVDAPTATLPPVASLFVGEGEHAPHRERPAKAASLPVVS